MHRGCRPRSRAPTSTPRAATTTSVIPARVYGRTPCVHEAFIEASSAVLGRRVGSRARLRSSFTFRSSSGREASIGRLPSIAQMNRHGWGGSTMSTSRIRAVTIAVVAIALVSVACSSNSSSSGSSGGTFEGVALTGAGATFPDPIYEQWFDEFKQVMPGAKINYQAIGSGGGVEQFTAKTVDFGASDAPLQADEISALPGPYIEVPTVLGGVVVAYNVSGREVGPEARRRDDREDLPGRDHEVERPGDHVAEPGRDAPGHADLGRAPVRRVGNDVRLHVVALVAEQGLGEEDRRRQGRELADRDRRRRQRRGRGRDQADGWLDRVPLLRLRGVQRSGDRRHPARTTARS